MVPRLYRAQKKCATYVQKLDASPYYLAARILNPQCRTAFLKDENEDITAEGEKKLYVVRKLWERFRDKTPFSAVPYESESISKSALQPEENLSIFHKARRKHILKQTRPQSQDEFDNYISENPIMLDSSTTAIQWWSQPIQRGRYLRLSQLAIEVLSIPGMSDKPERVFSGSRRRVL
jgi:hAT family C-terminal dimerisation region